MARKIKRNRIHKIPELDLPTFLFQYAEEHTIFGKDQETPVLIGEDVTIKYRELKKLSGQFASGLVNNLKLNPGDAVAIILENTVYYPVVSLGTNMMGCACMPTNPAYTVSELAYQFGLVEPRAIVTEIKFADKVVDGLRQANMENILANIVVLDNSNNNNNEYTKFHEVLSDDPFQQIKITTQEKQSRDIATILFSSGTSGLPKAVMLSHRNIVANIFQCCEVAKYDKVIRASDEQNPNHRYIVFLPQFHTFGLVVITYMGLSKGATMIIMRKYSLHRFCSLSEKYKATVGYCVPPVILDIVKNNVFGKYDLSNYTYFYSGAAPLSKELQASVQAKLGVPVLQLYGLSETSPISNQSFTGVTPIGSAGVLVPNMEAKVITEDGSKLGVNEVGEICLRGPNIMVGYFKNPQATHEVIDNEGFLHTGDVGYIDERGNLYISDRKKELIKYKGFQVPPAELEGILTDHPAVLDCAVISIYDESRASEIPKAFVVVRPEYNTPTITEEIREWVDSQVANHKKLRGGVEVIDIIPKLPSGKILRRHLRDREAKKT